MNTLYVRPRWAACVALFAFVFALAPVANAQQAVFADKDQVWWDSLENQLTTSLDSSIEQIQEQALQHIIFFATNYRDNVDLTNAAVKVLDLYETGTDDTHRTLALMALHAIGNEYTMNRLSETVQWESSKRIQQLTLAVLADYYSQTT